MGTSTTKHSVPNRVKPSFVIFDIRALWRPAPSVRVPGCQKLQMKASPVWHKMLYSCKPTHDNSGHQRVKYTTASIFSPSSVLSFVFNMHESQSQRCTAFHGAKLMSRDTRTCVFAFHCCRRLHSRLVELPTRGSQPGLRVNVSTRLQAIMSRAVFLCLFPVYQDQWSSSQLKSSHLYLAASFDTKRRSVYFLWIFYRWRLTWPMSTLP